MKKPVLSLFVVFAIAATFGCAALLAQDAQSGHGQPEPPMAGVHWAKGEGPDHGAKSSPSGPSSPNLNWHGGNIMFTAQTTAIFWGSSWANAGFTGDKVSGLDSFYSGMGYTGYAKTCNEFNDANGYVTDTLTYTGHIIDTSPANINGNRTSTILNEVCKVITNPVSNGYYPVYVDSSRGHAGYCAWHSVGTCKGVTVQFGFFFNLDGDPGCDPQDTSGLHSQGLAALANVSGHELSEARTDPQLNAWFDSQGQENSDKCAWRFGTPLLPFANGTQWKIQGNWSNLAYNAQTGYANAGGQKGCIDGGNFR